MQFSRRVLAAALIGCFLIASAAAVAQTGAVVGKIIDASGNPLPGAEILVTGSDRSARSANDGSFTVSGLPTGNVELVVVYLGFTTQTITADVPDAAAASVEVTLEPEIYAESVTVGAQFFLQGQAKALNQQRTAANIINVVSADQFGNFPDPNAAEATHRIPGVSLQRDQGEGRYISIRGTEPGLASTSINGVRLPSPEGDVRDVALDVMPADLLDTIEVSKAITPDMDADAIGGAVNLITKVAPIGGRLLVTAGGGYNEQDEDNTTLGNFTWGARSADGDSGLLISGSAFVSNRGSDNFEVEYDDGFLEDLQFRDYTIERERYGLTAGYDYRPSETSQLRIEGIWNEFSDQEFRRRARSRISDEAIEREIKDRFESQTITSGSIGGNTLMNGRTLVEYKVAYSFAEEDEPERYDTTFAQEDVLFDPNVFPNSIDPNNIRANPLNEDFDLLVLDEIVREDNLTEDQELNARIDFSAPFGSEDQSVWTAGLKARLRSKDRNIEVNVFEADDIFAGTFRDGFQSPTPFFGGRYELGPFFGTQTGPNLISSLGLEGEKDVEEDLADYDSTEDVYSIYGMADIPINDRTSILAGARYEQTESEYDAFELRFDDEGDFVGLAPISGDNSSGEFMPMVHLRYQIDDRSNLRAAATRTLARPRFSDLVPFQLLLEEDLEIQRGNPNLDISTAINLDLLYERYFESVGVFSLGAFYKDISDNVFLFTFEEDRNGETFDVTQPLNGDSAEVMGLEFAYQNRFAKLPAPWDGLGLYMNATFVDSDANFPDRPSGKLPGQSDLVANVSLSYEKGGFSGRLSYNNTDEFLLEVGGDPATDVFVDQRETLDLSVRQRFQDRYSLVLDVLNLTDEPFRVYEGFVDRPLQEEVYSWWATLSLRIDFK